MFKTSTDLRKQYMYDVESSANIAVTRVESDIIIKGPKIIHDAMKYNYLVFLSQPRLPPPNRYDRMVDNGLKKENTNTR